MTAVGRDSVRQKGARFHPEDRARADSRCRLRISQEELERHPCAASAIIANMLPQLDSATGLLPLGRHHVSLASVKSRFVDAPEFVTSASRPVIWEHFESAVGELQRILPVAYVWIAGSFITNKPEPDDLDLVFWCEDRFVHAVSDPKDRMILQVVAQNHLRRTTGLRLDTRIAHWHVHPEAASMRTPEYDAYVSLRGYWDDFWLRRRSGAKTDPPVRNDALPRAGYLEIMLDGVDVI